MGIIPTVPSPWTASELAGAASGRAGVWCAHAEMLDVLCIRNWRSDARAARAAGREAGVDGRAGAGATRTEGEIHLARLASPSAVVQRDRVDG